MILFSVVLLAPTIGYFYLHGLYPIQTTVDSISAEGKSGLPFSLISFDILFNILLALMLVCLLHILAGVPNRPGRILSPLRDRPILAFCFFTILCGAILTTAPAVFNSLLLNVRFCGTKSPSLFETIRSIHPLYIKKAAVTAVCFGLSIADVVIPVKKYPLRRLVYFGLAAIPTCPLLWWNAVAGWMPSRYWQIWRLILLAATCLGIVVVFPQAQPITNQMLIKTGPTLQKLDACDSAYHVEQDPENPGEALLRCGWNPAKLSRFTRDEQGRWLLDDRQKMDVFSRWKHLQIDPGKKIIYVMDGQANRLYLYHLETLELLATYDVPIAAFPAYSYRIKLSLDPQRELLAVACRHGFFFIMDTKNFQVLRTGFFNEGGCIWDLQFDTDNHRLFILQAKRLTVLNPDDFSVIKSYSCPYSVFSVLIPKDYDKILLSMPTSMKGLALDRKTLEPVKAFDAPLGVRNMSFDEKRRWVFLSSISGAVEILSADTLKKLDRVRVNPDIKGIEVFPEFGEAIITTGDSDSQAWVYDPPPGKFDLYDKALQVLEYGYRKHQKRTDDPGRLMFETHADRVDLHTGDLVLIFNPQAENKENTARSFHPAIGFNGVEYSTEDAFCNAIRENEETVSAIIIIDQYPEKVRKCVEPARKKRRILFKHGSGACIAARIL